MRSCRFAIFTLVMIVSVAAPCFLHGSEKASSYEQKLLLHINQYRHQKGLKPLAYDEALHRLAESHCCRMRDEEELSHDRFDERFRLSGRSICVENVGWNYRTPESQLEGWKRSKGHNANLLNREIRRAAIARTGAYVTFFACN